MAHIVKRKNREGKYYVYLVESFREKDKVKKRTLKSYGPLDELERSEPGAFERLKKEAAKGLLNEDTESKITTSYSLDMPLFDEDPIYGWKLFEDVFNFLDIPKALSSVFPKKKKCKLYQKTLELLVYQRILNPGSKLHTSRSQEELFGDWDLSDNDIYRSLEPLSKAKEEIQLRAHQRITEDIGRTGYLVFYDVTNYYFEIDFNDDDLIDEETGEIIEGFRKRGPCKSKSGKPIIQMGLFMDTKGIPISYSLFKGNQTDPVTYIPAIEKVKKQFGIERIVVVADKAMNSKNNIQETLKNGDGWLFSQKHRGKKGSPKEIQEFILDPDGWVYNETMTFALKSMYRERKIGNKEIVKEKVLVTWNEKYAIREKTRRDGAINYANKLTKAEIFRQTCKKGGKRYLKLSYQDPVTKEEKPFSPLIEIDEDQVKYDEQFDGINVIVTSELKMTNEKIIDCYKQLSKIEDCFRVTKTDLEAKPVYVRLKDHIEAHFLTCFLALVILRIIQSKSGWKFSVDKIKRGLLSARTDEVKTGFYKVKGNDCFKELIKELEIEWDKRMVKYEKLKNFGKSWCTTKN